MSVGVSEDIVRKALNDFFPSAEYISVKDISDSCGYKFDLIVVSSTFEGKPLLKRQRDVNEALKEYMPSIHAISMKTWTPSQWEEKKGTFN